MKTLQNNLEDIIIKIYDATLKTFGDHSGIPIIGYSHSISQIHFTIAKHIYSYRRSNILNIYI